MNTARLLMISVATSAAMTVGAFAADFSDPYAPYSSAFNFEGFYAGVLVGGIANGSSSYLSGADTSAFSLGGAVGVNFALTDNVLGGFEVQSSVNFGASGTVVDALALGRVGYVPSSDVMLYGASGLGVVGGSSVYAIGGGVEFAAMDNISVRGELLTLGTWGAAPSAIKGTAGVIWHMD